MHLRLATIFLVITGLLTPAMAAEGFSNTPEYKQCTALAAADAQKGVRFANDMMQHDGDAIGSMHCRAMAQFTLGNFHDSAKDLAAVYAMVPKRQYALRGYITRQAARALHKAGDTERALASLQRELLEVQGSESASEGLKERLGADLLLDRAQLMQDAGKPTLAIQELDHAVSLMPKNARVLLARARVLTQLGATEQAVRDVEMILEANPRDSEARRLLSELQK